MTADVVLGYTFASDHRLLDREQQATSDTVTVGQQAAEAIRLPDVGIVLGRWATNGSDCWALREPALRGLLGEADGLLGLGVLRKFKLAIDYARNTLYPRPGRAKGGVRAVDLDHPKAQDAADNRSRVDIDVFALLSRRMDGSTLENECLVLSTRRCSRSSRRTGTLEGGTPTSPG